MNQKCINAKKWGTDLDVDYIAQYFKNNGIDCDDKALAAIPKGYKGRSLVCGIFGHIKCNKMNNPCTMAKGKQNSQQI